MPRRRPTPAQIAAHAPLLEGGTTFHCHANPRGTYYAVFSYQDQTPCDIFAVENCGSLEEARHRLWLKFCDLLSSSGPDERIIPLGSAPTDQFHCDVFSILREA